VSVPARALTPAPAEGGWLSRWTRILAAYLTAQTLTQALGILAGLLFVNLMPVREFALYTLATSVVTFFTFLSDLGSTSSLVFFFRRSQGEEGELRRFVAAVLSLRKVAFLAGALAVAAAFPRASAARGFGLRESLPAAAGIILCAWFQLSSSVRVLALRLLDRYGQSYRAEVAGSGLRLAVALVMAAAGALWAWLGVLSAGLGMALTSILARPASRRTSPPIAARSCATCCPACRAPSTSRSRGRSPSGWRPPSARPATSPRWAPWGGSA
jgi:O-antigen/teichoic acid export membrane protein